MLRRLAAYPRQNGLAVALRELGRIERTMFTLDWLRDPALRRRANAGLNKGEARNALARAIFFNRLGEMRDRSFENQAYRASGLNLLVRSEEHTSELQSLMRISYAVFCLKKTTTNKQHTPQNTQ